MIKALLVVVTMTGSEYNVNMPNMKTCMEQARIVSSQGVRVETLCIPRVDNSAKVKVVGQSIWKHDTRNAERDK